MESSKSREISFEEKFNNLEQKFQNLSLRVQALEAIDHNQREMERVCEISYMHKVGCFDEEEKQRCIENGDLWEMYAAKVPQIKGAHFMEIPNVSPSVSQVPGAESSQTELKAQNPSQGDIPARKGPASP